MDVAADDDAFRELRYPGWVWSIEVVACGRPGFPAPASAL
jgi:hypothetical protein